MKKTHNYEDELENPLGRADQYSFCLEGLFVVKGFHCSKHDILLFRGKWYPGIQQFLHFWVQFHHIISYSAKNWERVMPNPLQIVSSVGMEGTLFLLYMFAIVDSDKPHSLASRYSVQPRSSNNPRSLVNTSIVNHLVFNITVLLNGSVPLSCTVNTIKLNCTYLSNEWFL